MQPVSGKCHGACDRFRKVLIALILGFLTLPGRINLPAR